MNEIGNQSDESASSSVFTTPDRERMFRKIIYSTDAFFKQQRMDEADLTESEKHSICARLYSDHPLQFLARYHQYLDSEDVICFRDQLDSASNHDQKYEINYYLAELSKRKPASKSSGHPDSVAKNRRFAAMKKLASNADYFSDYEMRERDPLLYDQMIGQYQTETEQQSAFHSGDRQATTLSSVLLDMFHAKELSIRRHVQMEEEATANLQLHRRHQDEEMDEDEEEEEEDDDESNQSPPDQRHRSISDAEKQSLRDEFVREMQERFLDGRDVNFDYRTVDENPEYDLVEARARDEEDKYFDEEEPEEFNDQDRYEQSERPV